MNNFVRQSIDIVKSAQLKLDKFIYAKIQEGEAVVPWQVVSVQNQDVDGKQKAADHLAQVHCGKKWSMATLTCGKGQITVGGKKPKMAILDSGCSAAIFGRSFAFTRTLQLQKYGL